MLKKTLLALACMSGFAGCSGSFPQTTDELKSMAASSPLVAAESYTVSRSASAVASSLQAMSRQCLNRTSQNDVANRQTQFGMQFVTFITRYETTVRRTGNGSELSMRMVPIKGGVNEPKEGHIFFAADVQPSQGGTTVTHYQGSIGSGAFSDAVKGWANGTSRTCPDLPR
jgi:hypothetical protein